MTHAYKKNSNKKSSSKADDDAPDKKPSEISISLPNISELKNAYDITEEHITEKQVLRKILEHLEDYIKIIVQVLQPEEFHSMHECTAFDDADKKRLFDIYKSMMILHRDVLKKLIHNDKQAIIDTIMVAHGELSGLKPEMLRIIDKMQSIWKKSYSNGRAGYFG